MLEIVLQNLDLVIFLALMVIGYTAGSIAEKRHYASIEQRERELLRLMLVNASGSYPDGRVKSAFLVSGSAVISVDYFKRFLAMLRNLFGGRVRAYESLLDRSRREAILRMKEEARAKGAVMIMNMRLETSTIGTSDTSKNGIGCVETLAYGTAVVLNPQ
ncbi:MAG: YbjQ family protein [Desulfuromonadales bacterium]|nr:YbjQ family protein [Desulfuromonadales bacterium]